MHKDVISWQLSTKFIPDNKKSLLGTYYVKVKDIFILSFFREFCGKGNRFHKNRRNIRKFQTNDSMFLFILKQARFFSGLSHAKHFSQMEHQEDADSKF